MHSSLAMFGALLRSELFMAALIVSGVGGVAAWVGPDVVRAFTPEPPPIGEVTVEGAEPEERRLVIDGLRQTLEGSYALVGAAEGGLALWQRDAHDLGALNADEALLILHSPSLQTLNAVYIEDGASEKRIAPDALLTSNGARRFRTSASASSRVIATGVSDVSVATSPGAPGQAEVALTLTWSADPDDPQEEAGASRTTLRVRLHRIEGLGR